MDRSFRRCIDDLGGTVIGSSRWYIDLAFLGKTGTDRQLCQEFTVKEKIDPQQPGNAEYPLAVRNIFQYVCEQPFSIFNYSFLMTRWAELTTLTRKCKEILMAAFFTSDQGESHVKITAIQVL